MLKRCQMESRPCRYKIFECSSRNKRRFLTFVTLAIIIIIYSNRSHRFLHSVFTVKLSRLHNITSSIRNNSLRCPNQTLGLDEPLSNERWKKVNDKSRDVYLYSAFYDDRPLAGDRFVRINLVGADKKFELYCHIWYEDYTEESYVVKGVLNETGMNPMVFDGVWYLEYILSCPVPNVGFPPKFVSVSEKEACESTSPLLPVIYEYHKEPPIEFGVCVVNGHGKFTPQEMVEWFEFYRLMGVEEFNLYNTSYKGVDDVLEYYIKNKTLILNQIPHPLGLDGTEFSMNKIRNLRSTCLNDCMMRNMYRYRYLVVIDHDEFIVPRGNITNYHDLIQEIVTEIGAEDEVMSIGFVNVYFFKTFRPDMYQPRHMKTFRYRYRSKPLHPYVASKSILRPTFCFNLMNHYCYVRLPLYRGSISYFAPSSSAMSQHYRFCGKFIMTPSCSEMHAEGINDDTMLKFREPLLTSVDNVLRELRINF